jgi:hypothetical protein
LLEDAVSSSPFLTNGTVYVLTSDEKRHPLSLTYEDVVDKIFESDRVMVI